MKKKLLATLLSITMVLTMAGCSGSSDSGSDSDTEDTETSEETAEEESEETDTEEGSDEEDEESSDSSSSDESDDWEAELAEQYEVSGDESYVWGYIASGFTDTFCAQLVEAIEEYTAENFPNVTLNIADGELDINTHIELAENFLTQGIDCLLVSAADSDGETVICDMAEEVGVPVVVVNADVACDPIDHWFVGSDHYLSGQLQAEYLIDYVDDTETINLCYLGGTEGYTFTTLRREGFYETLDEAGYNYEILSDLEGEYLRDRGMEITEDWLIQYGDDIDVIVAANDEMAMGALNAIQGAGMSGIIVCGIDANDDVKEEIADGNFGCSVYQSASGQAKWGAIAAYAACQGQEAATLDVPYELVTIDNLDEYM